MAAKPLPLVRLPAEGELLLSFLGRNAAEYGVSAAALLVHGLPAARQDRASPDEASIRLSDQDLGALSYLLRQTPEALQALTLTHAFPSLTQRDISFSGAASDMDIGEDVTDGRLRIGWCPLCLLEDRGGGGDHHLRLDWALAPITMCHAHDRPLIERCQRCYRFVRHAGFARYGEQLALICPHCLVPLDGAQGFDFVSNHHVLDWQRDKVLPHVWRRLRRYERVFLKALKTRQSKTQRLCQELRAILDILLRAKPPGRIRPVDLLGSAHFPAPAKLGGATRHLWQPFHVCCLAERRKAMAILIAVLEDCFEDLGFGPAARALRGLKSFEAYDDMQFHLLSMTRLAAFQ